MVHRREARELGDAFQRVVRIADQLRGAVNAVAPERLQRGFAMVLEPDVVEMAVAVMQSRAQFLLVEGLGAVLTQITLQTLGKVVVGAGVDGGRKGRGRHPDGGSVRPVFQQTQQQLGE